MTSLVKKARALAASQSSDLVGRAKNLAASPTESDFQEATNRGDGAPFLRRLAAAFKSDAQGVENYLKANYGDENVFKDANGDLFFYPPNQDNKPLAQRKLVRFNPNRWDIGDFANLAPIGISALTGIGAAALTGGASVPVTLATLFGGGIAGEGINQTVGASLPGQEAITPSERAVRAGVSGAFEAAAPGVFSLARRGLGAAQSALLKTTRGVAERLFAQTPDVLNQARQLEAITQVPFTAGERTQSRALLSVESAGRQLPTTSGIAQSADSARLQGAQRIAQEAIASLGRGSKEYAGESAINAHKSFLNQLNAARRSNAAINFGEIDKLAGDKRYFSHESLFGEIDNLVRRFEADVGSTDADAMLEFLSRQRDRLLKGIKSNDTSPILFDSSGNRITLSARNDPTLVTARSFLNTLSDLGAKAKDPRGLVDKVLDPSTKKFVATRLFQASLTDLQRSAASQGLPGQIANAMQRARKAYLEDSKIIEEAASQPISSFMEKSHLFVDDLFSKKLSNQEAHGVMEYLQKISPESANEMRSAAFQELLDRSAAAGSSVDDFLLSPAKAVTFARKNSDKLKVLFAGDEVTRKAFEDFTSAAKILSNRGVREGSQTSIIDHVKKVAATVALGSTTTALYFAGNNDLESVTYAAGVPLAAVLSGRFIIRALMTPQGAQSYAEILKAAAHPELLRGGKSLRAVKQAFANLSTQYKRLEVKNEVKE